jgi:cyclohexyl-isocyanide hydratase
MAAMQFACVLFPNLTQLDLTGPFEVFRRLPGATIYLVAATPDAIESEGGLTFLPNSTFSETPICDVLFVPGGTGVNEAMLDDEMLAFLRLQGDHARWVTSACTGALLLGAAGLLAGYEAATHWASMEFLQAFGAWPREERVVVSANRITGGGVTAGIDIALRIAEETHGRAVAEEIRLAIEYRPEEPSGDDVRRAVLAKLAPMKEQRRRAVEEAARKVSS